MKTILAQFLLFAGVFVTSACQHYPTLPDDLQGQAAIVLGFNTESVEPYDGGTLYTGFWLESINGTPIEPVGRYAVTFVAPGPTTLAGHCYWRLRGNLRFEDDLWEPGELTLTAEPNQVYTVQSNIDEYKSRCTLTVVTRPAAHTAQP